MADPNMVGTNLVGAYIAITDFPKNKNYEWKLSLLGMG